MKRVYSLYPDLLGGPTTISLPSASSSPSFHLQFISEPQGFGKEEEKGRDPARKIRPIHLYNGRVDIARFLASS